MIFATLGTHHQPFDRLIDALAALPAEELVVQHGHSPAPRTAARAVAFMPFSDVMEQMEAARAVITHAGVGSILCARRAGHIPIVVPRLKRHGEHVDDHQLELTRALAERGVVVPALALDRLADAVDSAPQPRPGTPQAVKPLHEAVREAVVAPSPRSRASPSGGRRGEDRTARGARAPRRLARPAPVDSPRLELEPIDDLESVRTDWERLAERSGNIFHTWDWARIWWDHFGRDRPLRLTSCRNRDGAVEAILPLFQARRRPLRLIRFVGHGPGDHLGPICPPESVPAVGSALTRLLREPPWAWDLFLAERLPSEAGWSSRLGGTLLRRVASPSLSIDGCTWEEFLQSRSANFRSQVRSRERRLARDHDLRYRLTSDPERLAGDLDTLFRLHEARWRDDGGSGALSGARQRFHRAMAARALERGWLRLWFLEADGRAVAAWYGFRFGDSEWYYQAGRDPGWDRLSVGFVLFAHTIRQAFEEGVREYQLLRGGEEFKARFANRDVGLDTIAWSRGASGAAGLAALAAAAALPPDTRGRLVQAARR